MQNLKKLNWQWLLIIILLTAISVIYLDATAKNTKYAVCIMNDTNQKIFYKAGWCTRDGQKWTGWVNYSIPADYVYSHWSDSLERMDIGFHTGGKNGKWVEYRVLGTKEGCKDSSTAVINWNNRGYLRLYSK